MEACKSDPGYEAARTSISVCAAAGFCTFNYKHHAYHIFIFKVSTLLQIEGQYHHTHIKIIFAHSQQKMSSTVATSSCADNLRSQLHHTAWCRANTSSPYDPQAWSRSSIRLVPFAEKVTHPCQFLHIHTRSQFRLFVENARYPHVHPTVRRESWCQIILEAYEACLTFFFLLIPLLE
jgi:hypothetical protein